MKAKLSVTAKDRSRWDRMNRLRDSYRCRGRIKAEGKKAKPSFCFREKLEEGKGWGKITVLELHSKVTGKQIGFYGGSEQPFVKDRQNASTWDYLNGRFAQDEFRRFLTDAGQRASTAKAWEKVAKAGLKEMVREAKKLQ